MKENRKPWPEEEIQCTAYVFCSGSDLPQSQGRQSWISGL